MLHITTDGHAGMELARNSEKKQSLKQHLLEKMKAWINSVLEGERFYGGMSEDAVAARIQKIEEQWNTPNADLLVKEMMSSRASRWLQHQRALKPQLLKIIVADENGARVAATEKPLHYAESAKEHWQAIYAHGNGAVNVTDVRSDERTQFNYVSVAVPVLEEGSGRFIGAPSVRGRMWLGSADFRSLSGRDYSCKRYRDAESERALPNPH